MAWRFNPERPVAAGSALCAADQNEVLRSYVYRYTGDHKPAWVIAAERKNGVLYPVHFRDDADWLAHTHFNVTKAGRLDKRCGDCQSTPTWPFGNALLFA